ncbi:MAG: T9SS type A sorting domain-containing protein [Saprospiraceae bacterium]|nr:T9SS type A sorting domain-containing protein [Saprospiraceae bacterium]
MRDTATISKTTDHLLYTNLWQNNLRISSSDVDKEYQFDLIITNLEGKLALKKKIVLRQTLDIGLENLIQGMYILHILENNEVIKTDKIVLTR